MKTVTISEIEYNNMQQNIFELQKKLELLQDDEFIKKLDLAFMYFFNTKKGAITTKKVSLKRGSAKKIITYMADDFTAPVNDFKDYI
ncbi:MAG: DUF2281 domain-containing protein [Bacteroidales bacterium]|nr:DUF2281 domain-containing protein [Bacteroidales bacterium]